jgi:hypothetical protein
MSAPTAWQTDNYCLSSSALLRARIQAAGPLTQECGCGRAATSTAGGDW